MPQKESGPAAINDEAGCFGGNGQSNKANTSKKQGSPEQEYFRSGPVHLLADKGCEPPFVVLERLPTKAFVWIANAPRGIKDGLQEFLNPDGPSVVKYAKDLERYLEAEANKEMARRERLASIRWSERIARATGGEA